jgi:hypothetical protein
MRQPQKNEFRAVCGEAFEVALFFDQLLFLPAVIHEFNRTGDAQHDAESRREVAELDLRIPDELFIHILGRAGGEVDHVVVKENREESAHARLFAVYGRKGADRVFLDKLNNIMI